VDISPPETAAAAHLQGGFTDFMSSPSKVAVPSVSASARGHLYRVAIVGAGTLKGKEVAEMLNERNFPAVDVRLLDDDESIGQLEATGDEINFIQSVRAEQFTKMDFTFFAADVECTRQNWKRARDAGSAIVDLSGALEQEPGATIRSLWVERERGQIWQPDLQPAPCVVAHPAAVTLALLLLRVRKTGAIRSAVATVFEPASEQGQRGMDELHQQTVNLLSFQTLPKDVFDTQVAFNMVARYGQNSKLSLDSLEQRVRRHYQKLAGTEAPLPALMVSASQFFMATARYLSRDEPSRWIRGNYRRLSRRRSRNGRRRGRRFAAEQCEHGWSGEHPGFIEGRVFAAQWNLAMGGRGQPARRSHHCGGMRREHDRNAAGGKNPMKWRRAAWLVLLAGATSCGYHTAGHAVQLPENVKTIAIPAFTNDTTTYRIEQMLTASVVREFTTRTHYHILNDPGEAADATLRGTVLSTSSTRRSRITPQPGRRPAFWWW
jgi:aspartate-semialdehyde dehydrogenase